MVWGIKEVDILTNLLLFQLVFCLFRLFQNTETPCALPMYQPYRIYSMLYHCTTPIAYLLYHCTTPIADVLYQISSPIVDVL
jgi:hypothetical protein